MAPKRNRKKQTVDLESRLSQFAEAARRHADLLPEGKEKTEMQRRALVLERGQWFAEMFATRRTA